MFDTDKYEGHSTEYTYELVIMDDEKELTATYALLNDAPLLLDFIVWVKNTHPHYYHKLTKAYQGAKSAKNNR
tara:strand:- start:358 stop:576 length:219 start_codon:yes stop_codon:yes gene_type:complete